MIKNADMTPMAFNDGIYYGENEKYPFDNDIVICYWSNGWGNYTPATAGFLQKKGHKLVNTHGTYYWVLGGVKCSVETAKEFGYNLFARRVNGDEQLNGTLGSMFCVWADSPGAESEAEVVSGVKAAADAFANVCPQVEDVTETPVDPNKVTITVGGNGASGDNTLTARHFYFDVCIEGR